MGVEGWENYKLSEIVEIIGGGTPKTSMKEYWNGDIPWLSVKDFNNDFRTVVQSEKTITKQGLENSSAKLLDKGDIVISARGTVGELTQLGRPMSFNQSCYGLKAKKVTTNDFVYYLLKHQIKDLQQKTHGSVFDTITKNTFNMLDVVLPPLQEQKQIAAILSALDDKIELNQRINQTLEAMAQALFQSWFVDFEPFRDGEFVESELGLIPKGWRVGRIEDLCEIGIGGDWGKDREFDGSIPVICLRGTDLQKLKETGYSTEAPLRWIKKSSLKKRELSNRDILLGGSGQGPVGRSLCFVEEIQRLYHAPLVYSNFCKRITAIDQNHAIYLEHVLERMYRSKEMKNYVNGTSVPNLDVKSLLKQRILIPDDDAIKFFAGFKGEYLRCRFKLENKILSSLRDTLLPKLMSGEIRVPIEEKEASHDRSDGTEAG